MKISDQEAHYYLSRKNWLTATIQQIKKDLFWQNIDLQLIIRKIYFFLEKFLKSQKKE